MPVAMRNTVVNPVAGMMAAARIGGRDDVPRANWIAVETPVERVSVGNISLHSDPKTVGPVEPKYITKNGTRIHPLSSSSPPSMYTANPPAAAVAISANRVGRRPNRSVAHEPATHPRKPAKAVKNTHHDAFAMLNPLFTRYCGSSVVTP